jgi:hypothetical protein
MYVCMRQHALTCVQMRRAVDAKLEVAAAESAAQLDVMRAQRVAFRSMRDVQVNACLLKCF